MTFNIHHGDCLEVLKTLETGSIDAIVTDPPYGLTQNKGNNPSSGGFMGKKWDNSVPGVHIWLECLRVLKPGGHLLAFGGARTYHRLAVAIEDAGFEIRDQIMWVYGQGFPKNHNVSKAIDKAAGKEREVIGAYNTNRDGSVRVQRVYNGIADEGKYLAGKQGGGLTPITAPATPEAARWEGWGTALKPAHEPIVMARKPLMGTVFENVLRHGTGVINIDACRVSTNDNLDGGPKRLERASDEQHEGWDRPWRHDPVARAVYIERNKAHVSKAQELGRFPANFIHDGSDEVVSNFPITSSGGGDKASKDYSENYSMSGKNYPRQRGIVTEPDSGSAARFFYCAKASRHDKEEGLDALMSKAPNNVYGNGLNTDTKVRTAEQASEGVNRGKRRNTHPTVKPTDLMRYLCRLVTPPGGVVLDPFMGSGSTGKAALLEGFNFIGIEREAEYIPIATARLTHALQVAESEPVKPAPVQERPVYYLAEYPKECEYCGAPANFGPLEPKEGEVTEIVDVELKCRECSERQWVNFKPYDPKECAPLFRTPDKESIV